MTKPNLIPPCKTCGVAFRKVWKRQIYCSVACSVLPRIRRGAPDECWEWQGSRSEWGYGSVGLNGRKFYTHRLAYEMEHGAVSPRLMVLHRCDNPPCCNPAHLFVGTSLDNTRDMDRKNRRVTVAPCGEAQHLSRLTERDVLAIRSSSYTLSELAREYGVDKTTIHRAKTKRTWRHI